MRLVIFKKILYPVTGVFLFLMMYFMLDGLILFRKGDFHGVIYTGNLIQWYVESRHTIPFTCTVQSLQRSYLPVTQPDTFSVLLFKQSLWVAYSFVLLILD